MLNNKKGILHFIWIIGIIIIVVLGYIAYQKLIPQEKIPQEKREFTTCISKTIPFGQPNYASIGTNGICPEGYIPQTK